jgi:hypothetical protein
MSPHEDWYHFPDGEAIEEEYADAEELESA